MSFLAPHIRRARRSLGLPFPKLVTLEVIQACVVLAADTCEVSVLGVGGFVLFEVLRVAEGFVTVFLGAGVGVHDVYIVTFVDSVEVCNCGFFAIEREVVAVTGVLIDEFPR